MPVLPSAGLVWQAHVRDGAHLLHQQGGSAAAGRHQGLPGLIARLKTLAEVITFSLNPDYLGTNGALEALWTSSRGLEEPVRSDCSIWELQGHCKTGDDMPS